MNKISLEEAKQLQYEMLKEMHRACEQHGLRYYLAYGTLLGAIRHKGYIPWDDDIDVMMPRDDFFKLAETYRSDRYSIVSCYNDTSYEYAFGRMYDTRTAANKGKFETKGLCIDIYLLNAWPKDEKERKRLSKEIRFFQKLRIYLIGIRNRLAVKRLWPCKTLGFPLLQWACKKEEMLRGKYVLGASSFVQISTDARLYDYKDFKEAVLAQFEDREFFIPVGYDGILKCCYGDYMQLPPVEERHPYHGTGGCHWK